VTLNRTLTGTVVGTERSTGTDTWRKPASPSHTLTSPTPTEGVTTAAAGVAPTAARTPSLPTSAPSAETSLRMMIPPGPATFTRPSPYGCGHGASTTRF